jgi:hypothetical protein
MIKNYFKIAWRNPVKYKGFSFINLSGLSIGIAFCFSQYFLSKMNFPMNPVKV